MIEVEMTCPKWHFCQIGQGTRKPYGGVFFTKIQVKKVMISCSSMPFTP